MDNGYPQTTDGQILSQFINADKKNQSVSFGKMLKSLTNGKKQTDIPSAVSNIVSWRQEGIYYQKNEIFMDLFERINVTQDTKGNVIKSEILGNIKMKSCLSGMPQCKLGLNEKFIQEIVDTKKSDFGDIKFHQCVRLSKFENNSEVQFVPPDGCFELFSYRLEQKLRPMFLLDIKIMTQTDTKLEMCAQVKSNFKKKCKAHDFIINIPVPCDAFNPKIQTNWDCGKAQYHAQLECIVWKMKSFQGQKTIQMMASFNMPSVVTEDRDKFKNIPCTLQFEVPQYTVSGIQIKYFKIIEKSNYDNFPWVRYIVSNGDYHIRTGLNTLY